jgi:hypothetical protein
MKLFRLLLAAALCLVSSAQAANIIPTPLPFILQNGQTADATQVMSDFNTIVTNVNTNAASLATSAQLNVINAFTQPQIVSPATALNHVVIASQVQQNALAYFVDTGAANAYVVTPAPAWLSYIAGSELYVNIGAGNTNTAASTINVNALGLKNILNQDGSALVANALLTGKVYHLIYDGTQFEIESNFTGGAVTSAINEVQGANIASAGTVNLDTATGNYVHITGTTTITAVTLSQGRERTVVFDGALTLTNGASLVLRNAITRTTAVNETTIFRGEAAGVVREISAFTGKPPTFQNFLSGSGTYNTPAGAVRIRIRAVGGGGGGAGSGSSPGTGGNGGDTTFSTLTASKGNGASTTSGGTGGTGTNGDFNLSGGIGSGAANALNTAGGGGGQSVFGGAGGGGASAAAGTAASTNSGSGGGGGGTGGSNVSSGGGGGAAGYVEKIIFTPAASYSYGVGAAGTAGGAGGGGQVGGAGGSGVILVEEYYQ